MNVTFFIGGLSGGGAERVVCNLSNYLNERGHTVSILTMGDDIPTYAIEPVIQRKCLINQNERSFFLLNSVRRIYRFIKYILNHKTDCYVVFLPVTTILLLTFRRLVKAKVIASERMDPALYPQKYKKKLRRLANRCDGWIFQTNEQQLWYGSLKDKIKRKVISNAINSDFILPPYNGERKKTIVTSGRLASRKNHKLLISAFFSIASDFPDYTLIIYGEGKMRNELENQIESLGLKNRVLLPGYTTGIRDNIYDASLYVLSSDSEGMPNALMEAMAMGVPSISTDCDGGGARFLIENGKNGLLVPKNDVEALATAMRDLLSHPEKAERLGSEGRKLCERLAPEKIYGEWEEFIKDVVNN